MLSRRAAKALVTMDFGSEVVGSVFEEVSGAVVTRDAVTKPRATGTVDQLVMEVGAVILERPEQWLGRDMLIAVSTAVTAARATTAKARRHIPG